MTSEVAKAHVPVLIRRTAKEIAEAWWHDNRTARFRTTWPNCRAYMKMCWPFFVPQAKEALMQMLTHPLTSQHVKDEIYDALVAHAGIAAGTDVVQQWLPPAEAVFH